MKKFNIFCHSFQKVKPIYYKDSITQSEISQTFISLKLYDYGLQIIKKQNSVSQKIWILHKINKKGILNRNVRLLKSILISMHSIRQWIFFCMNYCINAAWHGVNQPVALLRCNGSPGCFDSDLQVICIVGSGVSHLPLDNTPYVLYGVQVRQVYWPIKHSNTMVIEPAFGTFGSVGRCQFLLENEISISIKLVSRRKHEVLKNFLVGGCVTVDLRKHSGPAPAVVMAAQIITDCGNFSLDFKQHGFCASPFFLQTLGPWFPNEMQNILSSENWLWTTEQQSSYFSP